MNYLIVYGLIVVAHLTSSAILYGVTEVIQHFRRKKMICTIEQIMQQSLEGIEEEYEVEVTVTEKEDKIH